MANGKTAEEKLTERVAQLEKQKELLEHKLERLFDWEDQSLRQVLLNEQTLSTVLDVLMSKHSTIDWTMEVLQRPDRVAERLHQAITTIRSVSKLNGAFSDKLIQEKRDVLSRLGEQADGNEG